MLRFKERSLSKELLDADHIPREDLILNMKELDIINSLLGGHSITLQGFKKLLGKRTRISVLEIGCGGGDNLRVIERYCKQNNIEFELLGIDINADIANYARFRNPDVQVVCEDYKKVKLDIKPDIIFSSLFCHHFSNNELIEQMRWMHAHAGIGFFINDLERNLIAYTAIKFLSSVFSKSYLVKHDAPLSVARSFKRADWEFILNQAGIQPFSIRWKWAFRFLIVCESNSTS